LRLPDFLRTTAFRAALVGAACFSAATLLLFAFIFWQATDFETRRIDGVMHEEAAAILNDKMADVAADVARRYADDLHRTIYGSVFSADGVRIAGDLLQMPDVARDAQAHPALAVRSGSNAKIVREPARMLRVSLPDGRTLVLARSTAALEELRGVIERALEIGLLPAIVLALAAGTVASLRALAKVGVVNRTLGRIMDGDLQERLPASGTFDALDQLAGSVNSMLDEIERLLGEVKGVGDNIAHDLRTPLTRLRSRLEGGRMRAGSQAELAQVVDRAIDDLDQCLSVITALLRIGELEGKRRRAGFAMVSLGEILREAADLYAPLAEERGLTLVLQDFSDAQVFGDRDLLFEAVANLLDNAVKFSPDAGQIRLSLEAGEAGPTIRVADTGPGIPPAERAAVLKRFYRADPSRHIEGSGLGLSLVAAILRLHGFWLRMQSVEGGFTIDIVCNKEKSAVSF
jgi:signal transduction histidine kinase